MNVILFMQESVYLTGLNVKSFKIFFIICVDKGKTPFIIYIVYFGIIYVIALVLCIFRQYLKILKSKIQNSKKKVLYLFIVMKLVPRPFRGFRCKKFYGFLQIYTFKMTFL